MSKEAIEFYHWMMKNDTPENADKYFHWSDEDMYNEFLKQKNSTKENDIPHSEIRRMESEGVYEEKFQRNSSSPTYFNDEWNKSNEGHDWDTTLLDGLEDEEWDERFGYPWDDESHALDMVMNDMVKDFTDDDIQSITVPSDDEEFLRDDESTYIDGVDERPIKKEVDYNDDEFDY